MDSQTRPRQQRRGWMPPPDQSGYSPLERSVRVIDLTLPPVRVPTPTLDENDPGGCHHNLRDHRRALRESYRRAVENQMRYEEETQAENGLRPFRWGAYEESLAFPPDLIRAKGEIGGDAARAWEQFHRRNCSDIAAEEVEKTTRTDEVRRRVDEMIRQENEGREDEEMRELLDVLPTFKRPDMENRIVFDSIIATIQEQLQTTVRDIVISGRGRRNIQLELSEILSWVQRDCNQHNLGRVFLVTGDDLDKYCGLIGDRIFHHLSSTFKKHNYLPQLRTAQARLRKLKQANCNLRAENEKLRSGVIFRNKNRKGARQESLFYPVEGRLGNGNPLEPRTQITAPYLHDYQFQPYSSPQSASERELYFGHRRSIKEFGLQQSDYINTNQTFQLPPRNSDYQGHPATHFADPDRHMRYSDRPYVRTETKIPPQHYERRRSPRVPQFTHHNNHSNQTCSTRYRERNAQRIRAHIKGATTKRYKKSTFSKNRMAQEPLPELDPVTGYGTVVAIDEVGPIYDYSNIERVTMRGGAGPYSLLEDDDDAGDDFDDVASHFSNASKVSNVRSTLGAGALNRMKRYAEDEEDDGMDLDIGNNHGSVASGYSGFTRNSSLRHIKHGDTTTSDPNNKLWGRGPPTTSGVSRSAKSLDAFSDRGGSGRRGGRGHGRGNEHPNIAPALVPFVPKRDLYAEESHGFLFSANKPDDISLEPTWTTLDPETANVNYEDGLEGQEQQQQRISSTNPMGGINTPLGATFGTESVVYASEIKDKPSLKTHRGHEAGRLTAKSLQKLARQQSHRESMEIMDEYIDISDTPPGPPNAPPSEPSLDLQPLNRGSEPLPNPNRNSLFVDDDDTTCGDQTFQPIDEDIKANFVMNNNAAHDVHFRPNIIEQRNRAWLAKNNRPVSYINEFGEGNSVEITLKSETRTRMMNERGEYDGKDLGQVKKRYMRGFMEMIEAREQEMLRASKEYRQWKSMSLEDRLARLSLIRQPIDLWKGQPGADPDDLQEMSYLPAIYKRRVARRQAKQRMKAILDAKAKNKQASGSFRTAGTGDTRDTIGRLGDCDEGFQVENGSAGSRTPQMSDRPYRTPDELDGLLRRALDVNASQNSPRANSGPPSWGMDAEANSEPSEPSFLSGDSTRRQGLFSGGSITGNSVAPPRPTRLSASNAHPSPLLVQSPGPQTWTGGSPFSAGGGKPRAPSSVGASSTVQALRNAPLGGRIFSGPGNDISSSVGTSPMGDFESLLGYDDSPLLKAPTDTEVSTDPLTGNAKEMYNIATENMQERGRVVVVRLHSTQDGLPKFTPGAIANRVFGGLVQEFQLHPGQRTAVVVFLHPMEARSFVHHFQNVREKGTGQEIRELQIEVSWYQGTEAKSILSPQLNILKHSILAGASRCLLISNIPKSKSHRTISTELSTNLNKLLLSICLITPPQKYLLDSSGRQAMIEFASLEDAIEAYSELAGGRVMGYEDADPEYRAEGTAKGGSDKLYCGCLGCEEKREVKATTREKIMKKRNGVVKGAEKSATTDAASTGVEGGGGDGTAGLQRQPLSPRDQDDPIELSSDPDTESD